MLVRNKLCIQLIAPKRWHIIERWPTFWRKKVALTSFPLFMRPSTKILCEYQETNLLEERDRSLDVRVRQADAIQARPRGRALHAAATLSPPPDPLPPAAAAADVIGR
jgi:hypothetical protein